MHPKDQIKECPLCKKYGYKLNKKTLKILKEAKQGKEFIKIKNLDEFFAKLET